MEDLEPRDADEGDELEAAVMQADHAFGAESVGTTVEEELAGESLDQRLAEERAGGGPRWLEGRRGRPAAGGVPPERP